MSETRIRGRVKSKKKSYGFIEGDNGVDHFFHWTYLDQESKTFKQLSVGDTVIFTPQVIEDKPRAYKITAVD